MEPNFWVLIPPAIYANERLTANAKLLYGRILALSNKSNYCYASNSFFALEFKVHKDTISEYISQLIKEGYLHCELIKENGQVKQRRLYPLSAKLPIPLGKNAYTPIGKNTEESIRDKSIRKENTHASVSFNKFYEAYPKKKARADAEKAWDKINPDSLLEEKILKAVAEQKSLKSWKKEGGRFIPYPATWLNQGRWDDYIDPAEIKSNITIID